MRLKIDNNNADRHVPKHKTTAREAYLFHLNLTIKGIVMKIGVLTVLLFFVGTNASYAADEAQLGESALAKGNYSTALVHFKNNLKLKTKKYGASHSDVALAHLNLGRAYRKNGQYKKALSEFNLTFKLISKIHGVNHHTAASVHFHLSNVYMDMKKFDQAIVHMEKNVKINATVYGANHSGMTMSYKALGIAYLKGKKYDQAIKYLEKSQNLMKKELFIYKAELPSVEKYLALAKKGRSAK